MKKAPSVTVIAGTESESENRRFVVVVAGATVWEKLCFYFE